MPTSYAMIALVFTLTASTSEGNWSTESRLLASASSDRLSLNRPFSSSTPFEAPSWYRFSGTSAQFAKFPVWDVSRLGDNSIATLTFQFRTQMDNGFLMYLDDAGLSNFIALTLLNRSVHLRFKFGRPKTVVLDAGRNLNDRRWHTVRLERNFPSITLVVDNERVTGTVQGPGGTDLIQRSLTYFGGLPKSYKLQTLTSPGVFFVSKFVGKMRNISMNGNFVNHIEETGVHEITADPPCSRYRNPCQNNGVCSVNLADGSTVCDCSNTAFAGKRCTERAAGRKGYGDAVASFRGSEWLSYDLTNRAVSSFDDEINLSFRTRNPNGLLLHTGKSLDYVNLSLKDGLVVFVVDLGSGGYEVIVEPQTGTFNDGEWHTVRVNRTLRQVDIVVDEANIHHSYVQDDYTQLTLDDVIYVGGSPNTASLPGSRISSNFVGCIKEVTYSNNKFIRLPISRMARDRDPAVTVRGNVGFFCSDPDTTDPITFMTSEARMNIPTWRDGRAGAVEFNFRTNEPNGLLLYANSTASDLFAIELYDGNIYVIVNLGSGTSRFRSSSALSLADGNWHLLVVRRKGRNITIAVDGTESRFQITGPNSDLDINNKLYLGGTDFGSTLRPVTGLWTAPMREGFVGCMRDFQLDGTNVDIRSLAKSSGTSTSPSADIGPHCRNLAGSLCSSDPCNNGATCIEGMNRFICDCSNTSFMGKTCDQAVVTSSFNGTQTMTFPMDTTIQTEGEEISLRFKTPLSSGILFATTSNSSKDSLMISIVKGGQIQLYINIDCTQKKNCTALRQGPDMLFQGSELNDRDWHRVKVSRRGRRVNLDVDGRRKGRALSGVHNKLEFDVIHLGMVVTSSSQANPSATSRTTIGNVVQATRPFVGQLENVVFNKVQLIDSCVDRSLACNANASIGSDFVVAYPVTFQAENSYVVMPTLDAYTSMRLFMSIKTTVQDGLILYNAGFNSDYIAVELVEGKIFYIYNLGNGEQVMSPPGLGPINDNQWHDIRITRGENNLHTMTVDGSSAWMQGSNQNINLDLQGPLYLGGVPNNMFFNNLPGLIGSRSGFQGCLGNLDLNGIVSDISGSQFQSTGSVLPGCSGPSQSCSADSCSNGGTCVQKWDDYVCDCSLTSYVGRRCQQHVNTLLPESIRSSAVVFDSGVIRYSFPPPLRSVRFDVLSIGFATMDRDAVLVFVDSAMQDPKDYLMLCLENGRITLKFNIGTKDVVLYEPVPVSDGRYHRCTVRRKWMNATMRIDNWPERTYYPSEAARSRFEIAQSSIPASVRPAVDAWLRSKEQESKVFNSQSTIQIGGIVNEEVFSASTLEEERIPQIRKPFRGQMVGFFFNDVRVFQLAAEGDAQVRVIGDVELIGQPSSVVPTSPTISQPTTTMATLTTFTTTKSTLDVKRPDDCDDEELCPISSGSGEGSGDPVMWDEDEVVTAKHVTWPTRSKPSDENTNNNALRDLLMDVGFIATTGSTATTTATAIATTTTGSQQHINARNFVDEVAESAYEEDTELLLSQPQPSSTTSTTTKPATTTQSTTLSTTTVPTISKTVSFMDDFYFLDILALFGEEEEGDYELNEELSESTISQQTSQVPTQSTEELSSKTTVTTTTSKSNHIETTVTKRKPPVTEQSSHNDATTLATKGSTTFDSRQFDEILAAFGNKRPIAQSPASTIASTTNSITTGTQTTGTQHNTSTQPSMSSTVWEVISTLGSKSLVLLSLTTAPDHTASSTYSDDEERASSPDVDQTDVLLTGLDTTEPVQSSSDNTKPVRTAMASTELVATDSQTSTSVSRVFQSAPPPVPPMSPLSSSTAPLSTPPYPQQNLSLVFGATDSTHIVTGSGNNNVKGSIKVRDRSRPPTLESNPEPRIPNIRPNSTTAAPDVASLFTEIYTGSAPIMVGSSSSLTTAMIAGIAAAAACCILILLFIMYRFRNRDQVSYNVNEHEKNYGVMPTKGKHVVIGKNGSIISSKTTISKQDKDKEYYV